MIDNQIGSTISNIAPNNVDKPGGVNLNLPLGERIKKVINDYGILTFSILIISTYVGLVREVNSMGVKRTEVEKELEGKIEYLKGKIEILLEDRKDFITSKRCANDISSNSAITK